MDVFNELSSRNGVIKTVDMHTSGEPTRIIVSGYPHLEGETLLEKRRCAKERYDDIRKLLMLEPRGHDGMYGAILIQETELTRTGEADIGVLFCHNEGYSTMCGHATIALGRFLVDTNDLEVFPRRQQVHSLRQTLSSEAEESDESYAGTITATVVTNIRLHAPCGVVHISVPTILDDTDGMRGYSDGSKPVRYLSVPSFVSRRGVSVEVPRGLAWRRLREIRRAQPPGQPQAKEISEPETSEPETYIVPIDVSYGGAFYVIVSAQSLGFSDGLRGTRTAETDDAYSLEEFAEAARILEGLVKDQEELFVHPEGEKDLEFCYGVMIVDKSLKSIVPPSPSPSYLPSSSATDTPTNYKSKHVAELTDPRSETGLLFFAQGQIDRSPTGSCVNARVALGIDEGWLKMGDWWTYESIVSAAPGCMGNGFRGRGVEIRKMGKREGVVVQVEGKAWYTGSASFVRPVPAVSGKVDKTTVEVAGVGDVLGWGFKLGLPM